MGTLCNIMVREGPSEQEYLSRVLRVKTMEADFFLSGPFTPIALQHVSGGGGGRSQILDTRWVGGSLGSGEQRCWLFSGLQLEGIYRKGGARARSLRLLAEFRRDARSVKLRPGEHFVEDVTDTLKRFFRELDDPVTCARLLPRWREAAGTPKVPKNSSQIAKGQPGTPPPPPHTHP